jgi:sigma-B regulation protein RsbU (phosphoserine phosphatase)
MPAVKIALRTLIERHADSPSLLAELNRIFLDNLPPASYFTLIYAVFDPAAGRVVHVNAGHPPALHLVAASGVAEWLTTEGPAVGLLHEGVRFEAAERAFDPGDVFVFYTDGISETEGPAGLDFGRERVEAAVRGASGVSAAAIVAAVHGAAEAFRQGATRADDATVIAVRIPPTAEGSR